ncbi:MAG TPA: S8 family serine peptidase, partial [Myxococcota bacterium]|nr:S8 family serine peptidase [Myxococcota bacterium]
MQSSPIILSLILSSAVFAEIPNDPLFDRQWGLNNSSTNFDIDAPEAWGLEKGTKDIAIVVIDTGIDYTHPELAPNMWVNPGEIPGNGIDDDNNGYIDDVHGVNVITGSGDPMDDSGHGTAIAGVIGAEGNNGIGIAGVMQKVSLIACKFLDKNGAGTAANAVKCLDYAADLATRNIGVTIVATNNAWGGGSKNEALLLAIKRQKDLGILFVVAAGASASNLDINPTFPAAYGLENMLVVASANAQGALAPF